MMRMRRSPTLLSWRRRRSWRTAMGGCCCSDAPIRGTGRFRAEGWRWASRWSARWSARSRRRLGHVIAYDDGEVRRQFNICYTARIVGGEMRISDESTAIRFVDPAGLGELPMHPTQRLRFRHYLEHRAEPYLG